MKKLLLILLVSGVCNAEGYNNYPTNRQIYNEQVRQDLERKYEYYQKMDRENEMIRRQRQQEIRDRPRGQRGRRSFYNYGAGK